MKDCLISLSKDLFDSIPEEPRHVIYLNNRLHNALKDVSLERNPINLSHFLHNDLDAEFEQRKLEARRK